MRGSWMVMMFIGATAFSFSCSSGDSQDKVDQGAADGQLKTDKQKVPPADSARPDQRPSDSSLPADQQQAVDTALLDQAIPDDQSPSQDVTAQLDARGDVVHLDARGDVAHFDARADATPQTDLSLRDQGSSEAAPQRDLSPDYSTGTLSCSEVYTCAQGCTSADTTCLPGCIAQGCGSATDTVIVDFSTCFYDLCFSECLTSFDTACQSCITTNCSAQATACLTHQC